MGMRCDYTVTCDGCGWSRNYSEHVISNRPTKLSMSYDPSGAVQHREGWFYSFGYAWHLCGSCANELVRGGLKRIQEIIDARPKNG